MDYHEISLLIRSRTPILMLETHEERRAVNLLKDIVMNSGMPIFKWSVSTGMKRMDLIFEAQAHLKEPAQVLAHIKASGLEGIYMLLDFHPYLKDPLHVRLLKELAMEFDENRSKLILVSHKIDIPAELKKHAISFELKLPEDEDLRKLIREVAAKFSKDNKNIQVKTDNKTLDQLVRNLKGLTYNDSRRLIHAAIVDDGAITKTDLPEVMEAKYKLMNREDLLSYEYETSQFSELAGMQNLKSWLKQREDFFHQNISMQGMGSPKGILLLGVQGCGKSMAAKAVAGAWAVPLLRLDFSRLYNKYIGETENNIRQALKTAEVMAPCVLWIDELEKGISVGDNDDGTSQRILGSFLTWLSENSRPVFIVATSNNIEQLPPELIRKGRLDEVFFVDLPNHEIRRNIFRIHAEKRNLDQSALDLGKLADLTEGFSGAEIEQLVVSAIYAAHANNTEVTTGNLCEEISKTKPLSVLMSEKISSLKRWAKGRTVSVD